MSAAPPPGLQPERTALAWRRTALGLATGSLVAGRLLAPGLGLWAWWVAAAGVVLAGSLAVVAHRRSGRTHRGGRLVTACAGVALLLGFVAAAFVLRAAA
ncbi:DUF202 domain-containing protein [Cellulomonas cellasea]|uniref:DUF202 domain-containing protein n=1 Tax=Cellulomonas cellasea TaxID=43670 RepID=A0A4Y3L169_9CELL|nr:DUF202 domain-containing protein [Cellulomonas cellasea]GEA89406.1 hypothetical protein CCE01nite_33550 [Cellulomonas cellasea]